MNDDEMLTYVILRDFQKGNKQENMKKAFLLQLLKGKNE